MRHSAQHQSQGCGIIFRRHEGNDWNDPSICYDYSSVDDLPGILTNLERWKIPKPLPKPLKPRGMTGYDGIMIHSTSV